MSNNQFVSFKIYNLWPKTISTSRIRGTYNHEGKIIGRQNLNRYLAWVNTRGVARYRGGWHPPGELRGGGLTNQTKIPYPEPLKH